ncbi:MAG: A/G-specific adenine glycosylase [Candidatus Diapherotrites archaeon]|uniref:Adenine DNA glycosylase n=1 Tax=Candidatus Iainarchaeum sp. TaxID=3101447 RepID=A0A8T4C7J9_9ARCH|nr:A/G-specific adenine glycosylase [Candidatus Diapherotrites archaeon]
MEKNFPSRELLGWFAANQRPLPWRKNYHPYAVWLSEVMAQQTRIDQMLPYYEKFLKQFPTLNVLADANEESVLKSWEGLGYYSRARNLQHAAKEIQSKFGGKIPETKETLETLKGFGPYISSAVASIAFNENVCVVDGNVLRVAARFWGDSSNIAETSTKKAFEEKLQSVLPRGKAREFNQALMELGALICVPQNPVCHECPLKKECFAFVHQKQNDFPVKTKKGKVPHKHFAAVRVEKNGELFLLQRKQKLLHGMYEFPMVAFAPLEDSPKMIEQKFADAGFHIIIGKPRGSVKHTYSHFVQHVHVFDASWNNPPKNGWFSPVELARIPLSMVQKKILGFLKK